MSTTSESGHRNAVPIGLFQHPQPQAEVSLTPCANSACTTIDVNEAASYPDNGFTGLAIAGLSLTTGAPPIDEHRITICALGNK